jgi:hypothetical protein
VERTFVSAAYPALVGATSLALRLGLPQMSGSGRFYVTSVGSGPSDPFRGYLSHRLALQSGIGQNRSIFSMRINRNPHLRNKRHKPNHPAAYAVRCAPISGVDVQEDACLRAEPLGLNPGAISLVGQTGRLPPANRLRCPSHAEAWAEPETAHPIDSFDKTDQRTLESFDSRAGSVDCNAFERSIDGRGPWCCG